MQIYKFEVGSFAVNNYLVHPENSSEAMLIDAGEDPAPILEKIRQLNLRLVCLVNTHGHADHIAGNEKILAETGARLLIHRDEVPFLSDSGLNLSAVFNMNLISPPADTLLKDGSIISLGPLEFRVLHTPGHTPGHISLVCDNSAFVGDVIFQHSIGRTDFPQASTRALISSIRDKIFTLPDETVLYPGHGPATTVENEKLNNPFVSF